MKNKHFYGPHSIQIISILVGSLLGDAHGEKRGNARYSFKQGGRNLEYLLWNWKIFSQAGYCTSNKPKLTKTIGKDNKIYFNLKFNTFTFPSLNFIFDNFYHLKIKNVPDDSFLDTFLTPLALATWIMDNGSKEIKAGLLINTNSFSYSDVSRLCKFLETKYKFNPKPRLKNKLKDQWIIYIPKHNMPLLASIISPFLSPDMFRKLSDS